MNYKLISSYLFFINVYVCYINEYYIYTILFINLLISSIIYHWLEYDLYDNIENITKSHQTNLRKYDRPFQLVELPMLEMCKL